jgi:hypothetical protein
MTDGFVLAFGRFARFNGLCRVLALQNLHAGLFIAADDHASLFKETQRIEIQGTEVMGFGLKVGVVAVQPIHTAVGFEVCLLQNVPDTGATHGPEPPVV